MYTEQDLQALSLQCRKRSLWLLAPCALLAAGIVWSLTARVEWATTAMTIALGSLLFFCDGLLISPIRAYRRHVDNVLHGRTRETAGRFKAMETTLCTKEGVRYYPMTLSVGNIQDPEDDRLFYYDAQKPLPGWEPGQAMTVISHDREVGEIRLTDGGEDNGESVGAGVRHGPKDL